MDSFLKWDKWVMVVCNVWMVEMNFGNALSVIGRHYRVQNLLLHLLKPPTVWSRTFRGAGKTFALCSSHRSCRYLVDYIHTASSRI